MAIISPIFIHHAAGNMLPGGQSAATDSSESETAASTSGNADIMTFEYTDNPFESFMRDLELIAQLDPSDAYHRAQLVLMDKVFDEPEQLSLLSERVKELLDEVNNDQALEYNFSIEDFGLKDPEFAPSPTEASPSFAKTAAFTSSF